MAYGQGKPSVPQEPHHNHHLPVWLRRISSSQTSEHRAVPDQRLRLATTSEKTVTVEHYALPKFEVKWRRPCLLPSGDHVRVRSRRGTSWQDVGAALWLRAYTFDVDRVVAVAIEGETDDAGRFAFSFDLRVTSRDRTSRTGAPLLRGGAVTDCRACWVGRSPSGGDGRHWSLTQFPRAGSSARAWRNPLRAESYPDGTPAETEVGVTFLDTGETIAARTGAYGLAEVRFTPRVGTTSLIIAARDGAGADAQREFGFEGAWTEETVLLRPDGALYRVGDTMGLTVLASPPRGTVYLDIIREGQTISTRAVDVVDGPARCGGLAPSSLGLWSCTRT